MTREKQPSDVIHKVSDPVVGQLTIIVLGESRAFAGEVTETDPETGEVLAVYVTGGRMVRHVSGSPLTTRLLPLDWTDKQTVFSLCPDDGWSSLMRAKDVLEPLYREWLEKQKEKTEQKTPSTGLTDEQRRAWLAKYSIQRPNRNRKETK